MRSSANIPIPKLDENDSKSNLKKSRISKNMMKEIKNALHSSAYIPILNCRTAVCEKILKCWKMQ